jgi:SNF2 family DNA or RNA helicase
VIVLHAEWLEDRGLCLWGEDSRPPPAVPARRGGKAARAAARPHPFAARDEELWSAAEAVLGEAFPWEVEPTELVLHLPSTAAGPQASPRLSREEPAAPGEVAGLAAWRVPALELAPAAALDLLLAQPAEPPPGVVPADTLRHWGEAAKLVLELAARGRVVPALVRRGDEFLARWRPVVGGEEDAERLALLQRTMPPAARSAAPGRAARALLADALEALTDACVREALGGRSLLPPRRSRRSPGATEAWLAALVAEDATVGAPAAELERLRQALDGWLEAAATPTQAGLRTCFRLTPPGEAAPGEAGASDGPAPAPGAADGTWRLDFLLQATDDPSLLVPAERVWRARGGTLKALRRTLEQPQEKLLADLGRALRLYPDLEPALHTARPTGLDLDTAGAYRFLSEAAPLLGQAGFGVRVPPWWRKGRGRLGVKLRTRPAPQGGRATGLLGLEGICAYEWEVALGDETIPLAEFRRLARLKVPLVRLRGQWVELRREEIEAALELFARQGAAGEMTLAEALRLATGLEPSPAGLPVQGIEAEGWLRDLLQADGARRLRPVEPPRGFAGTLRPYQARGVAWLAFLDGLGLGACLADDMGLGKTVQLLALLQAEREAGADGGANGGRRAGRRQSKRADRPAPTLLVCPMSVVGNWQREAARFTPGLAVHVHHGGERLSGEALAHAVQDADLVITTYALAARDREELASIQWGRVVLDEAQNIKNSAARQTQAVRSFPARRRVALTGTPVENRLVELWSIFEFLNPGLLGSQRDFRTRFATPIERYHDEERAVQLKRVTGPFVLRRLKTDRGIIRDLPEKLEIKVFCNLTREQASLYQAVVDDMLARIEESEGIERKGLVLATMTKLKQVCNHPAQLLQDESALTGRSGKLARLEETLEEVLAVGDRVLVFTQFAELGRRLRGHLQERFAREVLFLHGGTPKKARDAMVARFQAGDGPPVFLLSLKAGGTGLNLTAANQVIHFDRWWNPAVEDQATDRAFRIGQRRDVQVRKLVCAGTLEERIDAMIEQKKALAESVVGTGESWLTELSTAELREVVALAHDAVAE